VGVACWVVAAAVAVAACWAGPLLLHLHLHPRHRLVRQLVGVACWVVAACWAGPLHLHLHPRHRLAHLSLVNQAAAICLEAWAAVLVLQMPHLVLLALVGVACSVRRLVRQVLLALVGVAYSVRRLVRQVLLALVGVAYSVRRLVHRVLRPLPLLLPQVGASWVVPLAAAYLVPPLHLLPSPQPAQVGYSVPWAAA